MSGKHTGHIGSGRVDSTQARGWLEVTGFLLLGLAGACGAADEARTGETASLQAVLSIERMEDATRDATPSASAMAQFVVLPSDADAHETLDAAGLRTLLPERTGCTEVSLGDGGPRDRAGRDRASRDLAEHDRAGRPGGTRGTPFPASLELLEAGEVSIRADGMVTRLALNLFPPSGSASGVIYTTPDQSAAPLPPDTTYAISASGAGAIPPLDIQGRAPTALRDVTISGVPLERAAALALAQPLDLTWAEGEPSDRVYVELAADEFGILCTFPDEEGSGTVPSALTAKFAPEANVRVAVHRVREAVQSQEAPRPDGMVLETTVRFDFELTSSLRVE